MTKRFKEILEELPRIRDAVDDIREILIANLAMIGEIPAPTFGEEARVRLVQQRFSECGLQNSSSDEVGNGLGLIAGEKDNNILVVAHADTVFPASVDHTMTLRADSVSGPGLGDDSLGLAVLVTLPTLLEHLGIKLKSTLVLMGASRSLGRGNLEGLKFFLANRQLPFRAGVCVEGVPLGRLSFCSIGMLRGEIAASVPEEYDWTRFGAMNAIVTLNEVINRLLAIRLPHRPRTTIVLGSIEGGQSYHTAATRARLRFEIRSEAAGMVRDIYRTINDIVSELNSQSGAELKLEVLARRKPGGITHDHPLARQTRAIMRSLELTPRIFPSMSELAAFADRHIPAVTVGLTTGENLNEINETLSLEHMKTGIAQLVGILLAVDGGHCDEE